MYPNYSEILVPVKGLSPKEERRERSKAYEKQHFSSLLNDLYMTDLSMDHRGGIIAQKDDLNSIMDLHSVDLEVDKFENSVVRDIFHELHENDAIVHRARLDPNQKVHFIDPLVASYMIQHKMNAINQANYSKALAEVTDLLATDYIMDGCTPTKLDNVNELIHDLASIDREMESIKSSKEVDQSIQSVRELYAIDEEIDRLGQGHNANKTGTSSERGVEFVVPLKGLSPSEQNQKIVPPKMKESAMLMFSSLMGDLYSTDLSMDSRGAAVQENDDIAAILNLHHVDQMVNKVQTSVADSLLKDIYRTDLFVDGTTEHKLEFIDNLIASFMRQQVISSRYQKRYDDALSEVIDLLAIDIEVDSSFYQFVGSQILRDLISVDYEMDSAKSAGEATSAFEELHDLYDTDKTVETFSKSVEKVLQAPMKPAAQSNQKRSIFSPQEKAAAQKRSIFSQYEKAQTRQLECISPRKY